MEQWAVDIAKAVEMNIAHTNFLEDWKAVDETCLGRCSLVDLGICSFEPSCFAVRELVGYLVIFMFSCSYTIIYMYLADIQIALDCVEFWTPGTVSKEVVGTRNVSCPHTCPLLASVTVLPCS
jgi:hypothetical protein